MTTYGEIRKETAAKLGDTAGKPPPPPQPCRYCAESTAWATLSALGARCQRCFDHFLRHGFSGAQRPREVRQAAWVGQAAKQVRHGPNAFAGLAAKVQQAQQSSADRIRGYADELGIDIPEEYESGQGSAKAAPLTQAELDDRANADRLAGRA